MPAELLLKDFFKLCRQEFKALVDHYGFSYLEGLAETHKGRQVIIPYQSDKMSYPFFAVGRYEKQDFAIEILCGDTDFLVQLALIYQRTYRLSLYDVLSVIQPYKLSKYELPALEAQDFLADIKNVEKLFKAYRKALFENIEQIIAPPEGLLEKALLIKEKRLKEEVSMHYRQGMDEASEKAKAAFQEGDFRKVIMLFRPYKDDLIEEDFKLLSLAVYKLEE